MSDYMEAKVVHFEAMSQKLYGRNIKPHFIATRQFAQL